MLLSAAPVSIDYGYDNNLSLMGGTIYTYDGLNISTDALLTQAKDVALNKDQLIVLTDNMLLGDSLKGTISNEPFVGDFVFATLIKDNNGYYLYATDVTNLNGSTLSFTTDVNSATVFNVNYPSNSNTLNINYTAVNASGATATLYIVSNTAAPIISSGPLSATTDTQYNYFGLLSGSRVSLISQAIGAYGKFIGSDGINLTFNNIVAAGPNNIVIPNNCIFDFTRFRNDNAYGEVQRVCESNLVKYTPINNSLAINSSSGEVPFNYLVTSPYKTLSANGLNFNVNMLKNYYSPRHLQTAVLDSQFRSYSKLYTGLNQEDGNDKIYIGYNASVAKTEFIKDNDTYFHYPYGTSILPLSASTIVQYGAFPNISPWRSDRIFKKVADYKNYSNWGNSSQSPEKGIYFCSWLSAGSDFVTTPVWVDRYFDPRVSNLLGISNTSISTLSGLLINSVNNYPNLIWDIPSSLTFEPGVLYYYHRIGDTDNNTFVNSFSGLTYHITEWGSVLYNDVTGLSAGQIYSFTTANSASNATTRTPYYVTGNTYGVLNTNESDFQYNQGNTLSFYAYKDNWANIAGDQIVGNYFNGGIGVFNNNSILTPYFTVCVGPSAIYTYNSDLDLLNYENYDTFETSPTDPLSGANFLVKGTHDGTYYIVDNYGSSKFLSQFDPDDLITNKIALTAFDTTLQNEKILNVTFYTEVAGSIDYIITKTRNTATTCCYRKFLTNGILVDSLSSTTFNNFVIDLSGTPRYFNSPWVSSTTLSATGACVDSTNNVYSLSSNCLVKNGSPILGLTNPDYVNCDQDDNIWITFNDRYLAKTNSRGEAIWTRQINVDDPVRVSNSSRVINFIAELGTNGLQYSCLVIDGRSQVIYKIDTDGNILSKISVPGLIPNGDTTGFDYQRKYIRPTITSPGIRAKLAVYDSSLTQPTAKYVTLNHSTSGMSPGWHHFAITYDSTDIPRFYVDGNLTRSSLAYQPVSGTGKVLHRIYNYKNNPQIAIGTSNFKTATLNQWINQPFTYLFNGDIADVRFYNIALNTSDIRALSRNYQYNQFNNLPWVIPTGTRSYIEEIERFFLHRLPGNKSQFYNIKIRNSGISDPNVREIVENNLRNASAKIAPLHTELRSITWE